MSTQFNFSLMNYSKKFTNRLMLKFNTMNERIIWSNLIKSIFKLEYLNYKKYCIDNYYFKDHVQFLQIIDITCHWEH